MQLLTVEPPEEEPLMLNDARLHLRVIADLTDDTPHPDDALINGLIQSARQAVESQLRRPLITQTIDVFFDAFPVGARAIRLPFPMQSVASLKYYGVGALQTLAAASYIVTQGGLRTYIAPVAGTIWPSADARLQAVQIRVVAGYGAAAAVPQCVKDWMKVLIATLYEHRGAVTLDQAIAGMGFVDRLLDDECVPGAF